MCSGFEQQLCKSIRRLCIGDMLLMQVWSSGGRCCIYSNFSSITSYTLELPQDFSLDLASLKEQMGA